VARALADSSDRDATFVEYRATCGCRIGMCEYTVVAEDRRTCLHVRPHRMHCIRCGLWLQTE